MGYKSSFHVLVTIVLRQISALMVERCTREINPQSVKSIVGFVAKRSEAESLNMSPWSVDTVFLKKQMQMQMQGCGDACVLYRELCHVRG
jgi:hypothetical protein